MEDLRVQRSETDHSDSDVNVNTGNDESGENDAEDKGGKNGAEDGVVTDLNISYFDHDRDQVTKVEADRIPNGGYGRAGQYEREQTQQQDIHPAIQTLPLEASWGQEAPCKSKPILA